MDPNFGFVDFERVILKVQIASDISHTITLEIYRITIMTDNSVGDPPSTSKRKEGKILTDTLPP